MKNRRRDIERYLRGELSTTEMHALEKEALNDPFLAEALEGMEQTGADNFLFDLHILSRSLHDRARARKSRTIRMWGWTAAIAATLLLVAVSGFIVIGLLHHRQPRQQAMESPAPEKAERPKDTVAMALERKSSLAQQDPGAGGKSRRGTAPAEGSGSTTGAGGEEKKNHEQQNAVAPDLLAENEVEISKQEEITAREDVSGGPVTEVPNATSDAIVQQRKETKVPQDEEKQAERKAQAERESDKRRIESGGESRAKASAVPEASTAVAPSLKGKVVSAEDGEALPGVTVRVKGTSIGSVTDAAGNYTITPPTLDSKLLFSFVGFETEEVDATGRDEINVKLKADAAQLNEVVVVTGYGSSSNGTIEGAESFHIAEPQGGKANLKRYLLDSLRYPQEALKNKVEGKVTIRFTVQPDGALTDFEVLKGIGSGCDEELIRLIKQGPAWNPATQGTTPVADKVKVRLKFERP